MPLFHVAGKLVVLIEYFAVLRVPLACAAFLLLLPYLASRKNLGPLLEGLFDLSWQGLFFVTATAMAAAGTIVTTAGIIYQFAEERLGLHLDYTVPVPEKEVWWLAAVLCLTFPLLGKAIAVSTREQVPAWKLCASACSAYLLSIAVAIAIQIVHFGPSSLERTRRGLAGTGLFAGYVGSTPMWHSHLRAAVTFGVVLFFYLIVGIYGRFWLGKRQAVPALCSPLMLLILLCWFLSALTFFLDRWHIPLVLPLAALAWVTARSPLSDHFYELVPKSDTKPPLPDRIVAMKNLDRIIVVAANGGGIQASAWASQVLSSLSEIDGFDEHLCLISSVSGSSVGTAYFVHWLEEKKKGPLPEQSAARSSLEAVAWGLAWPDFMRSICPWLLGKLGGIGRGRALEEAWCRIGPKDTDFRVAFRRPLSAWNGKVASGELPAIVLNATVVENGNRLLLGTTGFRRVAGTGCTETEALHGKGDVSIVTAARLSASFPYVTPAARAKTPGPGHHVVDGGYYDNYGMATLVEWLDEALEAHGTTTLREVLVIEILGAKISVKPPGQPGKTQRGWLYQAIAPLETLVNVRDAGQAAHKEIELKLLQEKWKLRNVSVESVRFEFPGEHAPLSWHLTKSEQDAIETHWRQQMGTCRECVRQFLQPPGSNLRELHAGGTRRKPDVPPPPHG
jgi:hypothetical protein